MNSEIQGDPRIEFFDRIAGDWDGWHNLEELFANFASEFERFGIQLEETVVDVGCGTGNLTKALLSRLGESGKVVALDISPEMLKQAKAKCHDPRVTWFLTSADRIPVADNDCDRVICFSAWPHFQNAAAVIQEIRRILKPDGYCHVLHFISRKKVNSIHKEAHPSVKTDILIPADELAELFKKEGFVIEETVDNSDRYLLSAQNKDKSI